jgi:60 kDa SS-A/Ro ribonucleoprotein
MCAGLGDPNTRRAALEALPRVARIGTHIFHFLEYVEGFRGWGRSLRRAIANWYNALPPKRLALQAVKYQNRDGWSHRDALRLAHPTAASPQHDAIFHWITQGWQAVGEGPHPDEALRLIWAFERAKRAKSTQEIAKLIQDYHLPRETIPTEFLKDVAVWEALLQRMPMTAMIRNLGKMTNVGLITPMSDHARTVVSRLADENHLRKARVHPLSVLAALKTYERGRGVRGSLKWQPVREVVDALDAAFYTAFGNVQPTGARIMLALDVSGSMASGYVAATPGITPRVASAAMALVTANVEANHVIVGFFCEGPRSYRSPQRAVWYGGRDGISPLSISPRQRLDDAVTTVSNLPFGGTDCALPMLFAIERKLQVDAFVIYTDSETWAGEIHPKQALDMYRQKTGNPAKLVVVGMVSNGFSIADPDDSGMLDVVGFDTATPNLISNFISEQVERIA